MKAFRDFRKDVKKRNPVAHAAQKVISGAGKHKQKSKIELRKVKHKKKLQEYAGFQNDVESGLGGTLGGADNVEKMDSYKDPFRKILDDVRKKKIKKQEK